MDNEEINTMNTGSGGGGGGGVGIQNIKKIWFATNNRNSVSPPTGSTNVNTFTGGYYPNPSWMTLQPKPEEMSQGEWDAYHSSKFCGFPFPIYEKDENGDPFEEWDGETTINTKWYLKELNSNYQLNAFYNSPSKSATRYIPVITDEYSYSFTLDQLIHLYWRAKGTHVQIEQGVSQTGSSSRNFSDFSSSNLTTTEGEFITINQNPTLVGTTLIEGNTIKEQNLLSESSSNRFDTAAPNLIYRGNIAGQGNFSIDFSKPVLKIAENDYRVYIQCDFCKAPDPVPLFALKMKGVYATNFSHSSLGTFEPWQCGAGDSCGFEVEQPECPDLIFSEAYDLSNKVATTMAETVGSHGAESNEFAFENPEEDCSNYSDWTFSSGCCGAYPGGTKTTTYNTGVDTQNIVVDSNKARFEWGGVDCESPVTPLEKRTPVCTPSSPSWGTILSNNCVLENSAGFTLEKWTGVKSYLWRGPCDQRQDFSVNRGPHIVGQLWSLSARGSVNGTIDSDVFCFNSNCEQYDFDNTQSRFPSWVFTEFNCNTSVGHLSFSTSYFWDCRGGGRTTGLATKTTTISGLVSIESLDATYNTYINSLSYPELTSVVSANVFEGAGTNSPCKLEARFNKTIASFSVNRRTHNGFDFSAPTSGSQDGYDFTGYAYNPSNSYKTHGANFSGNLPPNLGNVGSYLGFFEDSPTLKKAKIQLFAAPSRPTHCYVKIWLTIWKHETADGKCSPPEIISTTEYETTFGPKPCNFEQPIACSERANLKGYKPLTPDEIELNPYALIGSSFGALGLDPDQYMQDTGSNSVDQTCVYTYDISRMSFEEGWTPPLFQMSNFDSSTGCIINNSIGNSTGLFRHGRVNGSCSGDFSCLNAGQVTQINNWMASTFPGKDYNINFMNFNPYIRMTDDQVAILNYWFDNFVNVSS
jgi:hypothetical protein